MVIKTINTLVDSDIVIEGNQNVSVSDDGLTTITITGPDLTGLVTSSELTTELGILSAEIDSDIVVHTVDASAHHVKYTDADAVAATDAERTSLSGSLQTQIDGITGGVWEVLSNFTLQSDNTSLLVPTFEARDYLQIIVDATHDTDFSGLRGYCLRFNGDSGTQYSYTFNGSNSSFQNHGLVCISDRPFDNTPTEGIRIKLDVSNMSNESKVWTGSGLAGFTTTWPPRPVVSSPVFGVWYPTNQQITSIEVIAINISSGTVLTTNFIAGSKVRVLGTNFS